MRMPMTLADLAISGVSLSCGHWGIAPRGKPYALDLAIRLSADSGTPASPIDVTAAATNQGRWTVYHTVSCWAGSIGIRLLGPTGEEVYWYNPWILPLCVDVCCGSLDPGKSTVRSIRFDGHLFTGNGMPYEAPDGEYTVLASFGAATQKMGGQPLAVERRATFRWAPKRPRRFRRTRSL